MGVPLQVKDPTIEEIFAFLAVWGASAGEIIQCNQGGELAKYKEFVTEMEKQHKYKVERTGADSPSQNGDTEQWNKSIACTVRALLYGADLKKK